MNTTEYYEAVSCFCWRQCDHLIHNSFKVFNQFATILALTYEALQFGLDQYALVVSKSDVDVPRYHHPFESWTNSSPPLSLQFLVSDSRRLYSASPNVTFVTNLCNLNRFLAVDRYWPSRLPIKCRARFPWDKCSLRIRWRQWWSSSQRYHLQFGRIPG